jgi:hypothetical protein
MFCLTEHYLRTEENVSINFGNYTLGSAYCRQSFKQGGVCIYIANHISFSLINLDQYSKEKDSESCAVKISLSSNCFIIIGIYRAPTGNFTFFLDHLESILNILCKSSTHIILCGDFNIDYLEDSSRKHNLDTLLASYGLFSTVKFPTRTTYQSCTQIDNILINVYNHEYIVHTLFNGLSDHDGQILTFLNLPNFVPKKSSIISRKINDLTINNFILLYSYENWDNVFQDKDVNLLFNNFLNTYLRIFYTCFPETKRKLDTNTTKPWLNFGIRVSCINKRKLYLLYRKSKNPRHKNHYKL